MRKFGSRRLLAAGCAAIALVSGVSTGTATAAPGAPLPVAPYVDMGAWPTPSLSGMASAGRVKGFTLGFVIAWGCKASWFGAYDPRAGWMADEIARIRNAGGDVKVSFGGAAGIRSEEH